MGVSCQISSSIVLCTLASFLNSADRVIMPIAIVQLSQEYSLTLHNQGLILSAFSVGFMSSMILGGNAAKNYGGKNILTIAVLLWSMATIVTPIFANSVISLFMLRFFLGFGEGLGIPAIYHIFAHRVPVERRSRAFAYLVAMGTLGQTVAALICSNLKWRLMFYLFGSLGFLWTVFWILIYSETRHGTDEEQGFNQRVCHRSRRNRALNSRRLFIQPTATPSKTVHWSAFIWSWPLWSIYIAHFSMNWSNYIIMQWLPTYMIQSLGTLHNRLMYTAIPYITNSLFGIVAAHLADGLIQHKWSILSVRRLMTSIGLFGPGIFLLIFTTANNVFTAILLISLSMGLSACNSSGHLSNHADLSSTNAGITFAISNTIATLPGVLCGPMTAELVTSSNGRWFPVFIIAAFINFVGGVIYLAQSTAKPLHLS